MVDLMKQYFQHKMESKSTQDQTVAHGLEASKGILDSQASKEKSLAKRERIDLLKTQLQNLRSRYELCTDPEKKQRFQSAMVRVQDELDELFLTLD